MSAAARLGWSTARRAEVTRLVSNPRREGRIASAATRRGRAAHSVDVGWGVKRKRRARRQHEEGRGCAEKGEIAW